MSDRLRILQIHTRYREAGGEDVVVDAEAAVLREAGHEIFPWRTRNPEGSLAAAGKLALSAWNPAAARALREIVDRVRPDVAHVHNTWYALSPAIIAALDDAGIPVVMTLHNYRLLCANGMLFRDNQPCEDCVGDHAWHGVRHRCYRGSVAPSIPAAATIALHRRLGTWQRRVRLFLAMTAFAKRRFVAGGLPPDRIRVKPHFVDDPGSRERPPSASRDVLYVGRLSVEKGVDVLVDAFSLLEGCDLRLVVIGNGPAQSALERRAGHNVHFTGWLPVGQVHEYMRRARALAFPSRLYETFGMSILEAMAAGLPVLASDLGGSPEILGGRAGWLVAPGDATAWAAAIRRLADPALADLTGQAARRQWQDRFTPSTGLSMLEDAYQWVCRTEKSI
jgi:glycosyltransferase involved in cell wall biosynthesis